MRVRAEELFFNKNNLIWLQILLTVTDNRTWQMWQLKSSWENHPERKMQGIFLGLQFFQCKWFYYFCSLRLHLCFIFVLTFFRHQTFVHGRPKLQLSTLSPTNKPLWMQYLNSFFFFNLLGILYGGTACLLVAPKKATILISKLHATRWNIWPEIKRQFSKGFFFTSMIVTKSDCMEIQWRNKNVIPKNRI